MDDEKMDKKALEERDRKADEAVVFSDAGVLDAVEKRAREVFPHAKGIRVFAGSSTDSPLLLFICQSAMSPEEKEKKSADLIGIFSGRALFPFLLNEEEWKRLDERWGEEKWPKMFDPCVGTVELAGGYRRRDDFPASWRKPLVSTIDNYCAAIESAAADTQRTAGLALYLARRMLDDVLELLCAIRGLSYRPEDPKFIDAFPQIFGSNAPFNRGDLCLAIEIDALIRKQSRYLFLFGYPPDVGEENCLLKRVLDFFRRVRHFFKEELTTAAERRRNRMILTSIAASVVFIAVVALLLWFFRPPPTMHPVDDAVVKGKPGGIKGVYYGGTSFNRTILRRIDRQIMFRSNDSIAPNLPADNFSIRWVGFIKFPEGGSYYLCARSDDGVRVYLNEEKIIDDWKEKPVSETCHKVKVRRGWFRLKVEYFEAGGEAVISLLRGKKRGDLSAVAAQNLCCGN